MSTTPVTDGQTSMAERCPRGRSGVVLQIIANHGSLGQRLFAAPYAMLDVAAGDAGVL